MRAPSDPPSSPRAFARRVFAARLEEVASLVSFVAGGVAEVGISEVKGARLELAVEEWATNVCRYAYEGPAGSLAVVLLRDDARLVVELSDEGVPFDPTTAPLPDVSVPLPERKVGGLGLLMIRRLVDTATYRREGARNILTLAVGGKP